MKEIKIAQHTPEWHALRAKSLGASDAVIIMGDSPWKTPLRLWEEKVGLAVNEPPKPHMQRGLDLEGEALAIFNRKYIMEAAPAIGRHDSLEWMIASFDGYDHKSGGHVEIKCPGATDHATAVGGKVPSKYRAQLQQQMLVSGANACWYMSYKPEATPAEAFIVVEADPLYQMELLTTLMAFWKCVCELTAPAAAVAVKGNLDNVVDRSASLEWVDVADRYLKADRAVKSAEELREACRLKLIELAANEPSHGGGVRLSRTTTQGRIDYARLIKENNLDVEPYRAASAEGWRLTQEKR